MNVLDTDSLTEFVAENHRHWAREPASKLAAYLRWHQARGLLATSLVGLDVFGVCAIRLFVRLEDWLVPWAFDPQGGFALVDLLVSASPLATADCFEQLFGRWGERPIVMWERGDRTERSDKPPHMYRWDQYMALTRRLTYGFQSTQMFQSTQINFCDYSSMYIVHRQ